MYLGDSNQRSTFASPGERRTCSSTAQTSWARLQTTAVKHVSQESESLESSGSECM